MAAEIDVVEQVLRRWVRLQRQVVAAGEMLGCRMLMNAQSWNVCAVRTPNCV